MKVKTTASLALVAAAFGTLAVAGTASAGHDHNPSHKVGSYHYGLAPIQAETVPNSQAVGTTKITALPNGKIQVKVTADGLAPGLPHAMHLHGFDNAADLGCPGPGAAGSDGLVNVVEGVPFYGGILASLTTSGDTSAENSALALDRFPVADASGRITYTRTFDSALAWSNADSVQVVVHGIDLNGNGEYDFEAGPSELTAAAPLEATLPVICGGIAN